MKGFLKRDFLLILPLLKVCGGMILFFLIIGIAVPKLFNTSFLNVYITIIPVSMITSLFSFDEANRWQSYAATVPGGRRAQVDARYLVCVLTVGGVAGFQWIAQWIGNLFGQTDMNNLPFILSFAGAALLMQSLMLPLAYRLGVNRSRIWILTTIAGIFGAVGAISGIFIQYGGSRFPLPSIIILLVVIGTVFVLSHQISVRIMAKREF